MELTVTRLGLNHLDRAPECGRTFVLTGEMNTLALKLYEATGAKRTADNGAVTFEWTV